MKPQRIPAEKHRLASGEISRNATKVITTLQQAGFQAYLVGGGIRDLLLGLHPKDFDISTDARPEQVVELFRRSRIIGRRFRIVHVYFGRELIEVTTFRGHHPEQDDSHPHAVTNETGQLLRDNIYGSVEEDAIRRDFTVNSLYYDLQNNSLLDYTGGFADIQQRRLKIIGDPAQRYREDPVRMLRAIRFAAKLNFTIDAATAQPIHTLSDLLNHIPPARLFDEFLKLFLSGQAQSTFTLLHQYGLFQHLFPATHATLDMPHHNKLIQLALNNTDQRIAEDKGVTPAFLLAVFLWAPLQHRHQQLVSQGEPPAVAMQRASQQVIAEQLKCISIPRRFSLPIRDIWHLQLRLERRAGKRAARLLTHPRFRAAYDFLLLREQSGEPQQEFAAGLGQWWTEFQQANQAQRNGMVKQLDSTRPPRKRGPRKRR